MVEMRFNFTTKSGSMILAQLNKAGVLPQPLQGRCYLVREVAAVGPERDLGDESHVWEEHPELVRLLTTTILFTHLHLINTTPASY